MQRREKESTNMEMLRMEGNQGSLIGTCTFYKFELSPNKSFNKMYSYLGAYFIVKYKLSIINTCADLM